MKKDDVRLTLMGPDDQGFWYLTDPTGRDFRIVERFEDHCSAARLFGWSESVIGVGIENQNDEARVFLMEHVGEQIKAPPHLAGYFQR